MGGGGTHLLLFFRHLTIDQVSLSRPSTVLTLFYSCNDTYNNWVQITFSFVLFNIVLPVISLSWWWRWSRGFDAFVCSHTRLGSRWQYVTEAVAGGGGGGQHRRQPRLHTFLPWYHTRTVEYCCLAYMYPVQYS